MKFERNGNAKETMGIGLSGDAIEISSIVGNLLNGWTKKNGHYETREYRLKKRWFIPLPFALAITKMEKPPLWKLKLIFKAKTKENDSFETFWQFVTPWICIWGRVRKSRRKRKYAEVDLKEMRVKEYNNTGAHSSDLSFKIISEDFEKIEKIKNNERNSIRNVIYKEKIYEINPEVKNLL
jgi:hypothetical protein